MLIPPQLAPGSPQVPPAGFSAPSRSQLVPGGGLLGAPPPGTAQTGLASGWGGRFSFEGLPGRV